MRISQLELSHFKGVVGDLSVSLVPSGTSRAESLIISGDNGTGKSTIVDALEFVLQGRLNRNRTIDNVKRIQSRATKTLAKVDVTFSDNSTFQRRLTIEHSKLVVEQSSPIQDFSLAPLVLRRSDIQNFWSTPSSERQVISYDYFSASRSQVWSPALDESLRNLKGARINLKAERRQKAANLAKRLGVDVEQIPLGVQQFNAFINKMLRPYLPNSRPRSSPSRTPLPHEFADPVEDLRRVSERISEVERQISQIEKSKRDMKGIKELAGFLRNIQDRLTESFTRLSTANFVERVYLQVSKTTNASLTIGLRLKNGASVSPEAILSEANRDLLAFLVFLAVAQECATRGQARVLVLDGVFQSGDTTVRAGVLDYVVSELSDWQLILTVHDRLWLEQVRAIFQQNGKPLKELRIVSWSFDEGPRIVGSGTDNIAALEWALGSGLARAVLSQASTFLEEISNRLSWTLPISVTRRAGDKYTLGDLWPGCSSALKKTSLAELADEIDSRVHLRNLAGAHFNEWAESISDEEAMRFGEAVKALAEAVYCSSCSRWIEAAPDKSWSCRCGAVQVMRR